MAEIKSITSAEIQFPHIGEKRIGLFYKLNKKHEVLTQEASIIYGHNGAGKSTISRELQKFAETGGSNVKFLDKNNNLLNFTDSKEKFFIFNDDFVNKNIHSVESTGLSPIVLIGDKAKIQQQVDEHIERIKNVDIELNKHKDQFDTLNSEKEKHQKSLKDSIRSGWKSRSARYSDNFREKNFIYSTIGPKIKSYYHLESNLDSLKEEFELITKSIQNTAGKSEVYWSPIDTEIAIDVNSINTFLKSTPTVDTNNFTEYEKLISQDSVRDLKEKILTTFSPESQYCKECFQEISEEYKTVILNEINNYIEKVNEINFLGSAKKFLVPILNTPELPENLVIEPDVKINFQDTYKEINTFINEINNLLLKKAEAPFEIFEIDVQKTDQLNSKLDSTLGGISHLVTQHNRAVSDYRRLQTGAEELNCKITALENSTLQKNIESIENQISQLSPNRNALTEEKLSLEREVESLQEKFKDISLATEYINSLLKIVFGHDAMQICVSGDSYEIINRNHSVSPQNLSTGEKNILALCYFIVNLSRGGSIFNDEEKFIVLDDPISSLDYDNKYGIISLINYFINKLFKNNKDSRIAIFTHDLGVVRDLQNIFNKSHSSIESVVLELNDGDLTTLDVRSDLYLDILERMYRIVVLDEVGKPQELLSHNEVRRLWEAYTTFELGEKITVANVSNFIINHISATDSKVRDFIDRFSCHAFINTDSHSEFQIKTFNHTLEPVIGEGEFRRYIEDILCFIYIISPNHIISRLGRIKNYSYGEISGTMDALWERTFKITEIP